MKTLLILLVSLCFSMTCISQTVTIKEYVDMQSQLNKEWQIKYIDAEMKAVREAVDKANSANDIRFAGINEFRGQLKDQAGTFISRSEVYTVLGILIAGMVYINRKKTDSMR